MLENPKGVIVINGRIILNLILKRQGVILWTGFVCVRLGSSDEAGKEPLGSIKVRGFLISQVTISFLWRSLFGNWYFISSFFMLVSVGICQHSGGEPCYK
jgi:hypothetical protein